MSAREFMQKKNFFIKKEYSSTNFTSFPTSAHFAVSGEISLAINYFS
jgi:hypothetical protein